MPHASYFKFLKSLPKILTPIPGPKSIALAQQLTRRECPNITNPNPIFWDKAKGANVWDGDGNRYIDLTGGFGVASTGYSNSSVLNSLVKQTEKLITTLGDVYPACNKVMLLDALIKIVPSPLEHVFLGCTGSEAVEIALKTAMLATKKPGVIVFEGAYHGLTYGVLGATSMLDFDDPFQRQLGKHFYRLPFPSFNSQESIFAKAESLIKKEEIGALMIEPIQGRGGIRPVSSSFLKGLRELCDRNQLLLIFDEIYSGMGRTGKWFAFEHSGVIPDLVTIGKGLSGGFPISACIGTKKAMSIWPRWHGEALHTSTLMGNPLGCAMALASIHEIQRLKLLKRASSMGKIILRSLKLLKRTSPLIGEVRGKGLMIGLEILSPKTLAPDPLQARKIADDCLKKGVIILTDGIHQNVLTITPPLVITEKQIAASINILKKCLSET